MMYHSSPIELHGPSIDRVSGWLTWTPGHTGICLSWPEGSIRWAGLGPSVNDAVPIEARHITVLRRQSLMEISELWSLGMFQSQLVVPAPPPIELSSTLVLARRGPHPTKDPLGCTMDRRTWFLALFHQAQWHDWATRLVVAMNALMPPYGSSCLRAELGRYWHVSMFNNRGGASMRSIGDICADDGR